MRATSQAAIFIFQQQPASWKGSRHRRRSRKVFLRNFLSVYGRSCLQRPLPEDLRQSSRAKLAIFRVQATQVSNFSNVRFRRRHGRPGTCYGQEAGIRSAHRVRPVPGRGRRTCDGVELLVVFALVRRLGFCRAPGRPLSGLRLYPTEISINTFKFYTKRLHIWTLPPAC